MDVRSTTDVPKNFLFSMLPLAYYVIIERGMSAPVHGREFFDFPNATDKYLFSG